MNATRIYAIFLRQIYLMRGSYTRIIPLFVWIMVDMVLWGFMTQYLNSVNNAGMNFVPLLLGAVLMWDFFSRVMQGLATAFFEDCWTRNFLNFFATPLSTGEYISGLVTTSIFTSIAGLIAMILFAGSVFGLSFLSYGVALFPALLTLFLFGIAIGILGITLVLRFGPAAEWLIWPMPALLSPFVGVFYPLSVLPAWMQAVAKILPPSYVFENIRAIVHGQTADAAGLWGGLLLSAGYVAFASWVFARIYRYALNTGLIARYGSETVS